MITVVTTQALKMKGMVNKGVVGKGWHVGHSYLRSLELVLLLEILLWT